MQLDRQITSDTKWLAAPKKLIGVLERVEQLDRQVIGDTKC